MKASARGRLENTELPTSRALLPIFEAISNSVHAIEDLGNKNGPIRVRFIRGIEGAIDASLAQSLPVRSVSITDGGIGFTSANFESFGTCDSRQKESRGGKGIGRFFWLKAFRRATISSVYQENGEWHHRKFVFVPTEDGIDKPSLTTLRNASATPETTVTLEDLRDEYAREFPKSLDILAQQALSHCLPIFALNRGIDIVIEDDADSLEVSLRDLYLSLAIEDLEDFRVGHETFTVRHVRFPRAGRHTLHLCAHYRSVINSDASKLVPDLTEGITDLQGRTFAYSAYVEGDYLDRSVRDNRSEFAIPETPPEGALFTSPSLSEIRAAAASVCINHLLPFTEPIAKEKKFKVEQYVSEHAPQYRAVLKHRPGVLSSIPANCSEDRLDGILYKADRDYVADLRSRGIQLSEKLSSEADFRSIRAEYSKFLEDWNEKGITELAQYVVYRRATLEFLSKRLRRQADDKYPYEDAVHEIIMPLRTTSDDVAFDTINLWILDERLEFHQYLASDKRFSQQEVLDIKSGTRPDIIVYSRAHAFGNSVRSPHGVIHIVEFKRPGLNGYRGDDNPIRQVLGYLREIRAGAAKDRHGRPLQVTANAPAFITIVCDPHETLAEVADDHQFKPTPDGGWVCAHTSQNAWIEIQTLDTLLTNAERRNRAFFEKLGMPLQGRGW